jgi:drug/metabolite transporter (DMT)-like permease|tara:strand:+ start:410 stop:595 length:186 start_codon:yes stop_codon:yes gene_type:complete
MFGIAVIFYGALSGESAAGSKSYWWGYVVELIAVFFFAFYEILYEKYKPTSEGNAHGDHAR